METKTHWKMLHNPDYIGAYALMHGDKNIELNVIIEKVQTQSVVGPDGKSEECTVAYLKGQKPMVVNSTNAKAITKALGSPYIQDWVGKAITLYVAKVKAFGDVVDALRVKTEAPVNVKPDFNPQHARWAGAVTAIKAGNTTIEDLKKSFSLTKENEQLLCDLSKSDAAQSAA
jgi:hypothetical protein